MTDADKLRQLRDELALSSMELAALVGISPKTVYNFLSPGFPRPIPGYVFRLLEQEKELRKLRAKVENFGNRRGKNNPNC